MPVQQCPLTYTRTFPGDVDPPVHVRCTYIAGHSADCSFRTLAVTDESEREELRRASAATVAAAPSDVQNIVGSIEDGEMDRFLELILSAAHDRKRTRRGTPGFPRVNREGYLRG